MTYAKKPRQAGITSLTYKKESYRLFITWRSNSESCCVGYYRTQNWSANSCGTLWSTYNFSPSPKLQSLYGENDCRTSLIEWDATSSLTVPVFKSGKFSHASGNSAYGTNYIVNAPEMFLIIAEANLKSSNGSLACAECLWRC